LKNLTFCKIDFAPHWGGEIIVTVKKNSVEQKKRKVNTVPDQRLFLLAFPRREAPRFLREAKKTGKA